MRQRRPPTDEIVGVHYSVLSADDIKQLSVTTITGNACSDEKSLGDRAGTLMDPAMGPTTEQGSVCFTCGQHEGCCSHFGSLDLAEPMFNLIYLQKHVLKILRVICWKCSRLRIHASERDVQMVQMGNPEMQLKALVARSKTIANCPHCSSVLPKFTYKKKDGAVEMTTSSVVTQIMARDVIQCFDNISPLDRKIIGVENPSALLWTTIPVPPSSIRPQVILENNARGENSLTHYLADIIRANSAIISAQQPTKKHYATLQYCLNALQDPETPVPKNVAVQSRRVNVAGIRDRITGKTGRIREGICAKRVDFASRTVITPDMNNLISELGVPAEIAMKQFFTEVVTPETIDWLQTIVDLGPDHPQGARNIFKFPNREEIDLKKCPKNGPLRRLAFGDWVERFARNGDWALFNRQPTLHSHSIAGFRIRIHPEKTFRFNCAVCPPFNADFDGDEMNAHHPQHPSTMIEIQNMHPGSQLVSCTTSSPIITFIQDHALGAHLIVKDPFIEITDVMFLLSTLQMHDYASIMFQRYGQIIEEEGGLPGSFVFSLLIPESVSAVIGKVTIKSGTIVPGSVLTKKSLGSSNASLLHRMFFFYGPNRIEDWIQDVQRLASGYLRIRVSSIGPSFLETEPFMKENVDAAVKTLNDRLEEMLDECRSGKLPIFPGMGKARSLEALRIQMVKMATNEIGDEVISKIPPVDMIAAGSKGSDANVIQTIGCLGQQFHNQERPERSMDGSRVLPFFPKHSCRAEPNSFIGRSFARGLKGTEIVQHTAGGRIGMTDTTVKTKEVGYAQRRLDKAVEGVMVSSDNTVRDISGDTGPTIVQWGYGGNCFHPAYETRQEFWSMCEPLEVVAEKTGYPSEFMEASHCTDPWPGIDVDTPSAYPSEDARLLGWARGWCSTFMKIPPASLYCAVDFGILISNMCGDVGPDDEEEGAFELHSTLRAQFVKYCRSIMPIEGHMGTLEMLFLQSTLWIAPLAYFTCEMIEKLWEEARHILLLSIAQPGTMVGLLAAFGLGEQTTQMTLNTFKSAGQLSASVQGGIIRFREIINMVKPKNQLGKTVTVFMRNEFTTDREKAVAVMNNIVEKKFSDFVDECTLWVDRDIRCSSLPNDAFWADMWIDMHADVIPKDFSPFVLRFSLPLTKNPDVEFLVKTLEQEHKDIFVMSIPDNGDGTGVILVRPRPKVSGDKVEHTTETMVRKLEQGLMETIISGIPGIRGVFIESRAVPKWNNDGGLVLNSKEFVITAEGSDLESIYALGDIDYTRTITNDVFKIASTLGIEAAREAIEREITMLLESYGLSINPKHIQLISNVMTFRGRIISVTRFGLNKASRSTMMRAAFEEPMDTLGSGAAHGVSDTIKGTTDHTFTGKKMRMGTNYSRVTLDGDMLSKWCTFDEAAETEAVKKYMNSAFTHVRDLCAARQNYNLTVINASQKARDSSTATALDYLMEE